uniref:ADP-ribosylation factor-like protein 4A n=3 Tax=Casuariiformes TaxID=8784 RepID=A0A8C4KGI6_DRONO
MSICRDPRGGLDEFLCYTRSCKVFYRGTSSAPDRAATAPAALNPSSVSPPKTAPDGHDGRTSPITAAPQPHWPKGLAGGRGGGRGSSRGPPALQGWAGPQLRRRSRAAGAWGRAWQVTCAGQRGHRRGKRARGLRSKRVARRREGARRQWERPAGVGGDDPTARRVEKLGRGPLPARGVAGLQRGGASRSGRRSWGGLGRARLDKGVRGPSGAGRRGGRGASPRQRRRGRVWRGRGCGCGDPASARGSLLSPSRLAMGNGLSDQTPILSSLPSFQCFHIVILGLDSAGKTTVLYRLQFNEFVNTVPTKGFNTEKIKVTLGNSKTVTFHFWDVGGQEKLRPLWKSYTRCTDGIVFVVDSVDVERMEEAKTELHKITRISENQGVPVLIIANKQDLRNSLSLTEIEKMLAMSELSSSTPWHLQPTCAIIGDGLKEGLEKLYDMIIKRRKMLRQQKKKR